MTVLNIAKKGLASVLVIGFGVLAGTAASRGRDNAAERKARASWTANARLYTESAYDRATNRFTGSLGPQAVAAIRALPKQVTVLVALRGTDVATCEDLGRQLRELHRASLRQPGWGMAILIDPAGEARLRGFMARERIPVIPLIVTDPAALLTDGVRVATPAALVIERDGRIRAGVSHSTRFKNVRSRSFAQELPLSEPGS